MAIDTVPHQRFKNEMRKSASLAHLPVFKRYAVQLRFGSQRQLVAVSGLLAQQLRNLTVGIVQIAKRQRLRRASLNARGQLTGLQIGLTAEIAFVRCLRDRMDKAHAVRTGGDAVLTTDAEIRINIDNPTGSVAKKTHRSGRRQRTAHDRSAGKTYGRSDISHQEIRPAARYE